jgi:hypothetical protein
MISSSNSNQELIQYFTSKKWGGVIDDDKYWTDEELLDSFIIFYTYCFAHLGLPRPSEMQYHIAEYVADTNKSHRLVWSPRGIA